MPEPVNCNLCGRDGAKLLFRLRDYRLFVDEVEWNVVRCRYCGLGYLNPRPTFDEVARYYPQSYFDERHRQAARYQRQARYVPGDGGRLLDIGTARGDFLDVMARRGWDVAGIEPFEEAGNPHGLQIYRQSFPEGCDLEEGSYDVITAWAVFEHLRDPAAAFRECSRLLRPGGHLIVQVPNLRSIYSRWAMQEDVPRHLFFFSAKTLRAYGLGVGFALERVIHTTDLFGGSGRGVLRLAYVRALGRSTPEFFEIWRTRRGERFRRWPALAVGWTGVAVIERVLLADWLVRAAGISGQVVAQFVKPGAGAVPAAALDRQAA
jgi:2-polyprenyl-3-methyl-5-hydroxy-6-metoxy-1,4-benzoquinol methylase